MKTQTTATEVFKRCEHCRHSFLYFFCNRVEAEISEKNILKYGPKKQSQKSCQCKPKKKKKHLFLWWVNSFFIASCSPAKNFDTLHTRTDKTLFSRLILVCFYKLKAQNCSIQSIFIIKLSFSFCRYQHRNSLRGCWFWKELNRSGNNTASESSFWEPPPNFSHPPHHHYQPCTHRSHRPCRLHADHHTSQGHISL